MVSFGSSSSEISKPKKKGWLEIALKFEKRQNFLNCIRALDGTQIWSPPNSGSSFYNYKGTFSMVLLALIDPEIRLIAVEVGALGQNSDSGIYSNSSLAEGFNSNFFSFPESKPLPNGDHTGPMPFVIVADEVFPLRPKMICSFPGKNLPYDQKICNYRHFRAHCSSENAFGPLCNCWCVLHTKISLSPEITTKRPCICVHCRVRPHQERKWGML